MKLHNGNEKHLQDVHAAVVHIDVGNRDIQQCSDAVMRLRAEYLFSMGRKEAIQFNFTNGMPCPYGSGAKVTESGSRVTKLPGTRVGSTTIAIRVFAASYLDLVFTYAGSASLQKELSRVNDFKEIKAGDVLIQGGSPGHAVIVLDVAKDSHNRKAFLLAQSYMPAQDIHILKNPENPGTAWYTLREGEHNIPTPEWTFYRGDLRRFGR